MTNLPEIDATMPLATHAPYFLVIAYGNALRRDDGAGIALAHQLAGQWQAQGVAVHVLVVTQLTPELAVPMADPAYTTVIFVDAASGAASANIQIQPLQVNTPSPALGHQLDPPTLLLYARTLYGFMGTAWLVTVPGVDFGLGEGFSAIVQARLATAPQVADEILFRLVALA